MSTIHMNSIEDQARALRSLREKRDTLKADFEEADEAYKKAVEELYQRMDETGVDGLKIDGINFVPSETVYANVQDRSAFVEWARDHDEELVENRERKALLNQLVRERIDNGEPLPPGIGFYVRETVAQRSS